MDPSNPFKSSKDFRKKTPQRDQTRWDRQGLKPPHTLAHLFVYQSNEGAIHSTSHGSKLAASVARCRHNDAEHRSDGSHPDLPVVSSGSTAVHRHCNCFMVPLVCMLEDVGSISSAKRDDLTQRPRDVEYQSYRVY